MKWEVLGYDELRQLCRWTDWAEHHAQHELERSTEHGARHAWHIELRYLSQTQVELRALTHAAKK